MKTIAVLIVVLLGACSDDPQLLNSSNNVAENNSTNNATNSGSNNGETGGNNEVDDNNSVVLNNATPNTDTRDYLGALPVRPTSEVAGFVFDMGQAYCERLVECRTDSRVLRFATARQIATVGDCVTDFVSRLSPAAFEGAVSVARRTFVAANAQQCLSAIPALACGDVAAGFEGPGVVIESCRTAFDGDGRDLADCTSNADCLSGLFCDRNYDDGCAGACVPGYIEEVFCGATAVNCGIDAYCEQETQLCTPLPSAGQACAPDGLCEANHFCYDDVCTASVVGFQAGQACDRISSLCALGLFCDIDDTNIGTCKELGQAGASCNADFPPGGCVVSSFCDAGTCAARISAGACSSSDECLGGWCAPDGCVDTSLICAL
jgi:hypothetical protein